MLANTSEKSLQPSREPARASRGFDDRANLARGPGSRSFMGEPQQPRAFSPQPVYKGRGAFDREVKDVTPLKGSALHDFLEGEDERPRGSWWPDDGGAESHWGTINRTATKTNRTPRRASRSRTPNNVSTWRAPARQMSPPR